MAAKAGTEVKVGIFVFVAILALAYMTTQVSKGKKVTGDMYEIQAYFDNVSGLKKNAPVEIAGIEVGLVKDIELDDSRARLTLALEPNVTLHTDSKVAIRTRGVLGDKYVEVDPGSRSYPALKEGGKVARSESPADIDQLFQKVGKIADDIGKVAESVSNVIGGEKGEQDLRVLVKNMKEMSVGLDKMVQSNVQSVNTIVANLKDFSTDLKDISGTNKKALNRIIDNFEVASTEMKTTMNRMNSLLAKAEDGDGAVGRLMSDEEMGKDLKESVASLKNVSKKIDEGKGTIGKLINDDKTGKELDKALEGINKYLAKQEEFKTSVDFHSEWMADTGDVKSYLNLKLQPSEDKYYLLGVVDDPKGRTETTITETKWRTNGGAWQKREEHEKETKEDRLKFNAQLAKRWHDLVLRGGLIESSGGIGLDYYLWEDRIKFFAEAFDFDDEDPPHLKAGGSLYFLRNFYITAGMDDFVSDSGDESFFAGAGIYFTDDDLKYIMSSAPVKVDQ
jgi:phospholipid/cholesterol/gamma-HCH transport system substrate-binding protein